jgi:hypothetical protein
MQGAAVTSRRGAAASPSNAVYCPFILVAAIPTSAMHSPSRLFTFVHNPGPRVQVHSVTPNVCDGWKATLGTDCDKRCSDSDKSNAYGRHTRQSLL